MAEAKSNESKENEDDSKHITSFDDNLLLDRAYGLCIGAAIGDSIGSFCEFRKQSIEEKELKKAMTMPGGGTWQQRVITGQVTDDSELALSLAYGLIHIIDKSSQTKRLKNNDHDNIKQNINDTKENGSNDSNNKKEKNKCPSFDIQKIATEYQRWIRSRPFDIGFCTKATLSLAPNVTQMRKKAFNYDKQKQKGNMANGSLMRCMPLCLYGYKLNSNNLYKLMKQDASLTHANVHVYLVNTCYAIMIQSLLTADKKNKRNRHKDAFNKMIEWLESQKQEKDTCDAAEEILKVWLCKVQPVWMNDSDLNKLHPATVAEGFVQIAFQRACYHLLAGSTYKRAIKSVVGEGGDTDTNACIVGGIIGAMHGLDGIPKRYIENIHKCNPKYDKNRDIFQAKWYFRDKIPQLLLENAPTNEQFNCVEYN